MKKRGVQSYAITAAQGMQNPHSAKMYGTNSHAGIPHQGFLAGFDEYCEMNNTEPIIQAIAGSYVNEIELHEEFREERASHVYMETSREKRLFAQRRRERINRNKAERHNERVDERGWGEYRDIPQYYFREEIPTNSYKRLNARHLNRKIAILEPQVPSQNEDPATGQRDLPQDYMGKSVIMPHSKQRLVSISKDLGGKLPRLLVTTGCCTEPNYNITNGRGKKANRHHQLGFCAVDIIDETTFLPRLIPARKDGTFVDLGTVYSEKYEPYQVNANTLILGDIHFPLQDELAMQASYEQIDAFNPKRIVIHDLIDFRSIAHHNLDDTVYQMWLAELYDEVMGANADSLEAELKYGYDRIIDLSRRAPKSTISVLPANHDAFIHKWLQRSAHLHDRKNSRIGSKIRAAYYAGDSVLQRGLEQIGKIPRNVHFLSLTDDMRPWGYECSSHGHLGKNGSRGSLQQFRESFGKGIIGHVHQLEVNGNAISVGTNSRIPLEYQKGQPSTSMHGNAVIWDEIGLAQALPIINGRWRK